MIAEQMEQLALKLAGMDRPDLIAALGALDCDFPMDFTEEYFDSISLERLKHIVLVASLHARNLADTA